MLLTPSSIMIHKMVATQPATSKSKLEIVGGQHIQSNIIPLSRNNRINRSCRHQLVPGLSRVNVERETEVLEESEHLRVLEQKVKKLKQRVDSGKKLVKMIDEENLGALDKV